MDNAVCGGPDTGSSITSTTPPISSAALNMIKAVIEMGSPRFVAGLSYNVGSLAMANSGPNTNGSQFFIMTDDYEFPKSYTIFGKVTKGMDVIKKIETTKTGAGDRPVTPVQMIKVTVND